MRRSSLYINLDNFEFTSCEKEKEYQRICFNIFQDFEKLKKSDYQNFRKFIIGNSNTQNIFYTGVEKDVLEKLNNYVPELKQKIRNNLGTNFIDTSFHEVVKIKKNFLKGKSVIGILFYNFLNNQEISKNGKKFIDEESNNPTFFFYMFDIKDVH